MAENRPKICITTNNGESGPNGKCHVEELKKLKMPFLVYDDDTPVDVRYGHIKLKDSYGKVIMEEDFCFGQRDDLKNISPEDPTLDKDCPNCPNCPFSVKNTKTYIESERLKKEYEKKTSIESEAEALLRELTGNPN